MSSQSEQIAAQAASDVYVAAHQGGLSSETDVIQRGLELHIYMWLSEHKACVDNLANSLCLKQPFWSTTAF